MRSVQKTAIAVVISSIAMVGPGLLSRADALPFEAGGQVAGVEMDRLAAMVHQLEFESAMQAILQQVQYLQWLQQQAEQAQQAEIARQQQVAQQQAVTQSHVNAPVVSNQGTGACGGATNGADQYIHRESGGSPTVANPSGAYGCYQIMPATWASSCSDLGPEIGSSPSAQAACASRLPLSAWGG